MKSNLYSVIEGTYGQFLGMITSRLNTSGLCTKLSLFQKFDLLLFFELLTKKEIEPATRTNMYVPSLDASQWALHDCNF